ncbi:MAG: hypothetical protein NDJ24_07270 [Alphaproteobacteria bacterium]|nr:hypothetical protein [Alphaproteobacteria bacterium]
MTIAALDYLFDEEIRTYHALPQKIAEAAEEDDNADIEEPFVPAPTRALGPKPTLH